jgi:hypothetical protein
MNSETLDEEIARAQQNLIRACMQVKLKDNGHAISAYVNTTLLGAQLAALVEYTQPFELDADGAPIMKGTYQELLIKHLNARAELFLSQVSDSPRIQIAH